MFERVRFLLPTLISIWALFGGLFYVGTRLAAGETMKANRGILRMLADGLNGLAEALGPGMAGYGLMTLAIFGAVFCTVWVWREMAG